MSGPSGSRAHLVILGLLISTIAFGTPVATNAQHSIVSDAGHPRYRLLVFTKTLGARHESISNGRSLFSRLADELDFEVIFSENEAVFNPGTLSTFDAVVFLNTSGSVVETAGQDALREYILGGGGFLGIHSAADTNKGWTWFGELLGAFFQDHSEVQEAMVFADDLEHPLITGLPVQWTTTDEWYNFETNPRSNTKVLLRVDESSYTGGTMGSDHPIAWCHELRDGRSFYTGLGHSPESYTDPVFVSHLLTAIEYVALGDPNCEDTPADTSPITDDLLFEGRMELFPNPSAGNISVSMTGLSGVPTATIRVFDTTGRLLSSKQLQVDGSGTASLSLGDKASGMYLVRVDAGRIGRTFLLTLVR